MITKAEAQQLLDDGGAARTEAADRLGPVVRVFLDEYTDWPIFFTIHSASSRRETYVALHEATLVEGDFVVPYTLERVRAAPQVEADQDLSISEEDALFDYYRVPIDGAVPSVAHLVSALGTDVHCNLIKTPVDH